MIYLRFLLIICVFHKSLSDIVCPKDAIDEYIRDPQDCGKFYRCYSGRQAAFSCASGLAFNTNNKVCDWPYNTDCDGLIPPKGTPYDPYSNADEDHRQPDESDSTGNQIDTRGGTVQNSRDQNQRGTGRNVNPNSDRSQTNNNYGNIDAHDGVYGGERDQNLNSRRVQPVPQPINRPQNNNYGSHNQDGSYGSGRDQIGNDGARRQVPLPTNRPQASNGQYGQYGQYETDQSQDVYSQTKIESDSRTSQREGFYEDTYYPPHDSRTAYDRRNQQGSSSRNQEASTNGPTFQTGSHYDNSKNVNRQGSGQDYSIRIKDSRDLRNGSSSGSDSYGRRVNNVRDDRVDPNYPGKGQNSGLYGSRINTRNSTYDISQSGSYNRNASNPRRIEPYYPNYMNQQNITQRRSQSTDRFDYSSGDYNQQRIYGDPNLPRPSDTDQNKDHEEKYKYLSPLDMVSGHGRKTPDNRNDDQTRHPNSYDGSRTTTTTRRPAHPVYEPELDENYNTQWHQPNFNFESRRIPQSNNHPDPSTNSRFNNYYTRPDYSNTRRVPDGKDDRNRPLYNPTPTASQPSYDYSDFTQSKEITYENLKPRTQWQNLPNHRNAQRPDVKYQNPQTPRKPTNPTPNWSIFESEGTVIDQTGRSGDPIDTINRLHKEDPFAVVDLMSPLKCSDTDLEDCTDCENLGYLKFPKVFLGHDANETITRSPDTIFKDCFRRCAEISCVGYSYSTVNGWCLIYNDFPYTSITSDENYVSVIVEPKTAIAADEWLLVSPAVPVGKLFASVSGTATHLQCLQFCNSIPGCKALGFEQNTKVCKLFNAIEGHELKLQTNTTAIQHISIFEKNDFWRYYKIANRRLNGTSPLRSFAISDPQECLRECLHTPFCLFLSIENDRECHLYTRMSTWTEDPAFESYMLKSPLNSSFVLGYGNLYFAGVPLKRTIIPEGVNPLNEVSSDTSKVTFLVERRELFEYPDSAILSLWDNPEVEAQSFVTNLYKDWEYLAFKRIPGLGIPQISNPKITSYKFTGQKSLRCLQICLNLNCSLIYASYDPRSSLMECHFFTESELIEIKDNIIVKNNTELFIRTLPDELLPLGSNGGSEADLKSRLCSKSAYKPTASENLNEFRSKRDSAKKDASTTSTTTNSVYYSGDFYRKGYNTKSAAYQANSDRNGLSLPFEGNDNLESEESYDEMAPHGQDYVGLSEEGLYAKKRRRRSAALTVRGISVHDGFLRSPYFNSTVAESEAGKAVLEILKAILPMDGKPHEFFTNKNNNFTDLFLNQFLQRIRQEIEKPTLNRAFLNKMMTTVRRARRAHDSPLQIRVPCQATRGSAIRQMTCKEDEMCHNKPNIPFVDESHIEVCKNTSINSTCPVLCKSGYKSTTNLVVCKKIGSEGLWNTIGAECLPDEDQCKDLPWILIKSDEGLMKQKLHYIIKYNMATKQPQLTVYHYGPENAVNRLTGAEDVRVTGHPCPNLKNLQASHINYKDSGYNKGHLTSPAAFSYSNGAHRSSNYFINVAPQDPFTQHGPWQTLTKILHSHLKDNPGFVVSGVCKKQIFLRNKSPSVLFVPKCFWSVVCTKTSRGEVTAAAFYHDNSHPTTAIEKENRIKEVMSFTNQDFVKSLIGSSDYGTIWIDALEYFTKHGDAAEADDAMLLKCGMATTLSPKDVTFWSNLITQSEYSSEWSFDFSDEVVKADDDGEQVGRSSGLTGRSLPLKLEPLTTDRNKNKKRTIGYISSVGSGRDLTDDVILETVTHLIYSFVEILPNGSLAMSSTNNDTDKSFSRLYQMLEAKEKSKNKIKLMFSVGGWNNSQYFSHIASDPTVQKEFIIGLIGFLDYWGFDGVDIIWEYPVKGGKIKGQESDTDNFVKLLTNIRKALVEHEANEIRFDPYLLTITGPGAVWIAESGFKLDQIIDAVDWINVMTFDYFGPFRSSWGAYTGPQSALYHGSPDGFPGMLNVEATIKHYVCATGKPDKIVLGLPFYGRYWENVGPPIDHKDNYFRQVQPQATTDDLKGGFVPYKLVKSKWLADVTYEEIFHNKTQTPYLWSAMKKTLLTYENEMSIQSKIQFINEHDLGGVFAWTLDFEDDDHSLLAAINSFSHQFANDKQSIDPINNASGNVFGGFKCNLLKERRWWTQYDDDSDGIKDRMCGKLAPLINGFYPICDPHNPGYSCCGKQGFCGSGPSFCDCDGCVNYGKEPEKALIEPVKPQKNEIKWHLVNSGIRPDQPNCGYKAPRLPSGNYAICNPDDENGYCCSSTGFCGIGPDHCDCPGCVHLRKNPDYVFVNKTWFDWDDGPEKAGRCGPTAPRIDGKVAGCNPNTYNSYCCGDNGFCGGGSRYCDCGGCINYKNSNF